MDTAIVEDVSRALAAAERAVAEGRGLDGTGFWRAVGVVRRDPALAARFADRIAEVDRRAFESGVRLRVPAWVGTLALAGASAAAVAALGLSSKLERLPRTLLFLAAFGALDVTTHSLTHWIAGRLLGIRFTHYFIGGPPPPRPGVKTDYASYLRTPARRRAVMHASGAVVTKAVPFAMIPAGVALDVAPWALAALVAAGAGQIVTDVLVSTKTSDWKKVRRELDAARRG